jgi:hypothetical protein
MESHDCDEHAPFARTAFPIPLLPSIIYGGTCLNFRGENFRGWLSNSKILESFLP